MHLKFLSVSYSSKAHFILLLNHNLLSVVPCPVLTVAKNMYAGQEETVRTGHGTRDWLRIGKGVCHPAYLTYMQSKS